MGKPRAIQPTMEQRLFFNYGHIELPPIRPKPSPGANSLDTPGSDVQTTTDLDGVSFDTSMFSRARGAAPDPILGMRDDFLKDKAEKKLNIAVGVYRTAAGEPYVLPSVHDAEAALHAKQAAGESFKEYLPPIGMGAYCESALRLLLGHDIEPALAEGRVVASQSISGTGGLCARHH